MKRPITTAEWTAHRARVFALVRAARAVGAAIYTKASGDEVGVESALIDELELAASQFEDLE